MRFNIFPYLEVYLLSISDDKVFELFCMVCMVAQIVLQDSLTADEIDNMDLFVCKLSEELQRTFGEGIMKYNFHLLRYLKQACRDFGPLSGICALQFKDLIGVTMRRVHGFNQMCREIGETIRLNKLIEKLGSTIQADTLPQKMTHHLEQVLYFSHF